MNPHPKSLAVIGALALGSWLSWPGSRLHGAGPEPTAGAGSLNVIDKEGRTTVLCPLKRTEVKAEIAAAGVTGAG